MPPSDNFLSHELAQVLSHYDIGVIHKATYLTAGSRYSPKMVVLSQRGKFLLKRRQRGARDLDRVKFAHAVQLYLASRSFPVTRLVPTSDDGDTVLQIDGHVYELFEFVGGVRYDGSAEATGEAGRRLAALHLCLADFHGSFESGGVFHDSPSVRRHIKVIGRSRAMPSQAGLRDTAESLMSLYNTASVRVNQMGFDTWPVQVVHGDWHPGNLLFEGGRLTAVLDFDLVRITPSVTDLANGMLQFSIVADRPNPKEWPDYLDQARLIQFLDGYRELMELESGHLAGVVDLMVETIVAEAVLPVAATGCFGNLAGMDFLGMILRKAQWIEANRDTLLEAIGF